MATGAIRQTEGSANSLDVEALARFAIDDHNTKQVSFLFISDFPKPKPSFSDFSSRPTRCRTEHFVVGAKKEAFRSSRSLFNTLEFSRWCPMRVRRRRLRRRLPPQLREEARLRQLPLHRRRRRQRLRTAAKLVVWQKELGILRYLIRRVPEFSAHFLCPEIFGST